MRIPNRVFLTLTLCGLAVSAAACGGTSSPAAPASPAAGAATPAADTAIGATTELGVGNTSSLGPVLTGADGHTLYVFDKDATSPAASNCSGICATTWPPATGSPQSLSLTGVTGSMIGSLTRPDGTQQLTYNGRPLYYYSEDSAAGQANGEGNSSLWYAITAAGRQSAPMNNDDLNVTQSASLGQVVTNQDGFTLYVFDKDTTPGQSACYSSCAVKWPPLTIQPGSRVSVSGVSPSLVGDITRTDGSEQLTMNGHPLYTFSGDSAARQVNGQGVDGTWYAVTPSGQANPTVVATGGAATSSGSGY